MFSAFKKPQAILGTTVPKRRFTGWAVLYFILYFCLPVLGLCFLLDLLFYLLFTRALGSCYALFCLLQ